LEVFGDFEGEFRSFTLLERSPTMEQPLTKASGRSVFADFWR
jgi:hypothetical protein